MDKRKQFTGNPPALPLALIFILAFTTIFFGGVHVWVRTIFSLAIFAVFLFVLWCQKWQTADECEKAASAEMGDAAKLSPATLRLILDPPSLAGIFFVVWGLLQLLPLPGWLLGVLSPETAQAWSSLEDVGARVMGCLSLYPFMTGKTLLLTLAFLLFYWLVLYGVREKKHLHWLIWGIILLGVLESLYGLIQLAGGRNIILWWENPFSGNVLTGTFINRNHLAGFLSMAICIAVGYLWSLGRQEETKPHRRKRRRFYQKLKQSFEVFGARGILVVMSVALMSAALLGSASRGGLIALACGLVFMMGLLLARYFRSRKGFMLMVLLSLVVTYLGYVATDRLARRFQFFFNMEDRIALARDALSMAQVFPLAGSGGGAFEFVYPRFQQSALDKIVDYAHNDWIQLAAEYGWPGFLVVFSALAFFLFLAISRWRTRHDALAVGVGLGGMGAVVAIAIHSLSDFNLHLPANSLLLALILAVTWRVLYSNGQAEGGLPYQGPGMTLELKRRWRLAGQVGMTVVLAFTALVLIQTWQADSLARVFTNSTLAFKEPLPEELRQARHLAPGAAGYWLWSADRLRKKPQEKKDLLEPREGALPEPAVYLLTEGLKCSPTDWRIWRELGWTFFLKSATPGANREKDLRDATRAIARAATLRPADVRLQMDAGNVALYAYRMKVAGVDANAWRVSYRHAVQREPRLAGSIADALALHLGPSGPQALKAILPPDSVSYLSAASFLLPRNDGEVGMDLIREGEKYRQLEIERVWSGLKNMGLWTDASDNPDLQKLAALDRNHPGVLLFRGDMIGALKQIDRRGEPIGSWQDTRAVANFLKTELDENRGDPGLQAYYLGSLSMEEGNAVEAMKWLRKSLVYQAQYFPTWVRLRDVMKGQVRSAGDQLELDALNAKIELFAMTGIVFDAWKWAGGKEGLPSWRVPVRVAHPVSHITLNFSAMAKASWALYLDGRFVETWMGTPWEGRVGVSIPPGEHEIVLVTWNRDLADFAKVLPFRLEARFD